jgi:glycosyl transferase, family 25
MKVYVINLDRHSDRLAHMREQLGDIGFERVDAVDGTKNPETTKGLTRFELACIESHRNAWRLFLSRPDSHACFLEDGIHLWPDFATLVHSEAWIPSDAHSVKLDTYLQKVKLGERRAAFGVRQVARLYTRHESSAAYALSRAGAERYMELTARPSVPADYSLFPKNPRRLGLRIYQLAPAVAIQDHLMRSEDGGQTFATAMTSGGSAQARRPPALGRLWREGARLVGQAAELREAIYLRAFLNSETTTIGAG